MIDLLRRPLFIAIVGITLLVVLLGSFPIVPETKQAVVVRFGKPVRILHRYAPGSPIGSTGARPSWGARFAQPVRILNRYAPGSPIGSPGAGISWRIPFAEQVVWIDKRVQNVDMQRQQVISTDQRRLEVDAFARS